MANKIPPWLMSLINAEFNTTQKQKEDEKGFFCVECGGNSLTKKEKEKLHEGHIVLQAYNASRTYGYKCLDILKLGSNVLDVSRIRPFWINNGCVFFPKSRSSGDRKHTRNIGRDGFCKYCGYKVESRYMYCSILCKVIMEPVMNSADIGQDLRNKKKRKVELPDLSDSVDRNVNANANNVGFRKRPRKGIPHRAPLF